MKKSIEELNVKNEIPNSSLLVQSLKYDLNYLKNENPTKTSIIKLLTGNYRVQTAAFPSDANQDQLHERKYELVSTNTVHRKKMTVVMLQM